jgi:hypothetical protein
MLKQDITKLQQAEMYFSLFGNKRCLKNSEIESFLSRKQASIKEKEDM